MSRAIIEPILKLARQIERGNEGLVLRRLEWIRRGLLGQVFGDEEFYCYRLDRRINLLGCCVSLLTASLFISGVAMLPAWILWSKRDGDALQTGVGSASGDWSRGLYDSCFHAGRLHLADGEPQHVDGQRVAPFSRAHLGFAGAGCRRGDDHLRRLGADSKFFPGSRAPETRSSFFCARPN